MEKWAIVAIALGISVAVISFLPNSARKKVIFASNTEIPSPFTLAVGGELTENERVEILKAAEMITRTMYERDIERYEEVVDQYPGIAMPEYITVPDDAKAHEFEDLIESLSNVDAGFNAED